MVHCFDALTLAALTAEFRSLEGGHLQKIAQGEGDILLLHYHSRGKGESRLLLSCHPRLFRAHLTWQEKAAPGVPSSLVMFLRKYLEGSTLLSVSQMPLERVLRMELGRSDGPKYQLFAEFMGQKSNLILADGEGRIMVSWRHLSGRDMAPGASYLPPPRQGKADWSCLDPEALASVLRTCMPSPLDRLLTLTFAGMSPILAKEILARSRLSPADGLMPLPDDAIHRLVRVIGEIAATLKTGSFTPTLVLDGQESPLAYGAIVLEQYRGLPLTAFSSMSRTLDVFYAGLDRQERLNAALGPLRKLVETNLNRCRRKESAQADELAAAADASRYLRLGQVLTANLHRFPPGKACPPLVSLFDYEKPAGPEVEVSLDTSLSAVDNAQNFFRHYRKLERSRTSLTGQLERTREERIYLEGVLFSLEAAEDTEALKEIRTELVGQNLLRAPGRAKKNPTPKASSPRSFLTSDGLQVLVGKNNRQNEDLTFRLAASGDLWFHAKQIPGSHCILRLPPGREAPPTSLLQAAACAARYSAARGEEVLVDYTQVRHVRKIPGGRPGQVRYGNQRTVKASAADLPDSSGLPPTHPVAGPKDG